MNLPKMGSYWWRHVVHRFYDRAGQSAPQPADPAPFPWEVGPSDLSDLVDYDLERLEYWCHAEMLGMGFADLLRYQPSAKAFEQLPDWVVHQHQVVPLERVDDLLYCAVAHLDDRDVPHVVSECAGCAVRFVLATPRDIEHALCRHFATEEPAGKRRDLVAGPR